MTTAPDRSYYVHHQRPRPNTDQPGVYTRGWGQVAGPYPTAEEALAEMHFRTIPGEYAVCDCARYDPDRVLGSRHLMGS